MKLVCFWIGLLFPFSLIYTAILTFIAPWAEGEKIYSVVKVFSRIALVIAFVLGVSNICLAFWNLLQPYPDSSLNSILAIPFSILGLVTIGFCPFIAREIYNAHESKNSR